MSCKICGRGACASWMHSISAQEKYEERESMSDDVDELRCEIQDLRDEIKELKAEKEKTDRSETIPL